MPLNFRALSSLRWPLAAFAFVELLVTFRTKSLATNDQALLLLEFLSAAHRTTCIRLDVFFLHFVL